MTAIYPITIGDKTGTVIYLDDWVPVEPEQATLAKVHFDDGSIVFFKVTPANMEAFETLGGPGSGNFGHAGRPGAVGGSAFGPSEAFRREVGTTAAEMEAEPLPASLKAAEDRLRGEPREHIFIVDATGKVVDHIGSDHKDMVVVETDDKDYSFKDAILTHNHPSGSGLSVQDGVSAAGQNLAEIRAVVSDGTYSLKRWREQWPRDFAERLVDIDNKIKIKFWLAIQRGSMTTDEANERHYPEMWGQIVSEYNGIAYDFEPKS